MFLVVWLKNRGTNFGLVSCDRLCPSFGARFQHMAASCFIQTIKIVFFQPWPPFVSLQPLPKPNQTSTIVVVDQKLANKRWSRHKLQPRQQQTLHRSRNKSSIDIPMAAFIQIWTSKDGAVYWEHWDIDNMLVSLWSLGIIDESRSEQGHFSCGCDREESEWEQTTKGWNYLESQPSEKYCCWNSNGDKLELSSSAGTWRSLLS